jgi:hypothetical protein
MPNLYLVPMVRLISRARSLRYYLELNGNYAGAHSWVRKALSIEMEGEQTRLPNHSFPCIHISDTTYRIHLGCS